jgi:hypothetical protein
MFHISASDPELPSYECAIIEVTTSAVCKGCNHHWMSDLESIASPVFTEAIKGGLTTIPARHHRTLATWAVKNALMLDCAFVDLGATRFIKTAHCRDLHVSKRPRPVTFVGVSSFGYGPGQEFRHAWAHRFKIEGVRLSNGNPFESYVVAFQYGYLSVLVAQFDSDEQPPHTFRSVDLILDDGRAVPADSFIAQVWPSHGRDLSWPPPTGLDATALEIWAKSGPFFAKA